MTVHSTRYSTQHVQASPMGLGEPRQVRTGAGAVTTRPLLAITTVICPASRTVGFERHFAPGRGSGRVSDCVSELRVSGQFGMVLSGDQNTERGGPAVLSSAHSQAGSACHEHGAARGGGRGGAARDEARPGDTPRPAPATPDTRPPGPWLSGWLCTR